MTEIQETLVLINENLGKIDTSIDGLCFIFFLLTLVVGFYVGYRTA